MKVKLTGWDRFILIAILIIVLMLASCSAAEPAEADDNDLQVAVMVALTQTAAVLEQSPPPMEEAPQIGGEQPAEETPQPTNGMVEGKVCFPSEGIPPMTIFFQSVQNGSYTELPINQNQSTYQESLPAGRYIAFAYPNDTVEYGGLYSQAVPCGLTTACTDHSAIEFEIAPGGTTSDVDICDWYTGEGDVSPHPNPPQQVSGTVQGKICFPSEGIPPMTVYFQNYVTNETTQLAIAENQSTYQIELIEGNYIAFAYTNDGAFGGLYSQHVVCGMTVECTNHDSQIFAVSSESPSADIDICDWYAPDAVPPPP